MPSRLARKDPAQCHEYDAGRTRPPRGWTSSAGDSPGYASSRWRSLVSSSIAASGITVPGGIDRVGTGRVQLVEVLRRDDSADDDHHVLRGRARPVPSAAPAPGSGDRRPARRRPRRARRTRRPAARSPPGSGTAGRRRRRSRGRRRLSRSPSGHGRGRPGPSWPPGCGDAVPSAFSKSSTRARAFTTASVEPDSELYTPEIVRIWRCSGRRPSPARRRSPRRWPSRGRRRWPA